jgi:hypothetical protein
MEYYPVMPVPDEDLQLLESYLDDELSADEVDALRDRLIEEPTLAEALADVRAARQARQEVYASMEPGELAVSDMVADVQQAIQGRMRWGGRLREGMRYAAAAACVMIGVMIGSRAAQPEPSSPVAGGTIPVKVAGGNSVGNSVYIPRPIDDGNVAYRDDRGDTTTISWPALPNAQRTSLRPTLPVATPRVVVLTDERGTIIAAQQFETIAEAREFVEDLRRAAQASGHTILPIIPSATPSGLIPGPPAPGTPAATPVVAEQF